MRLSNANLLLMFRALEAVVAGIEIEAKKNAIYIRHKELQLAWIVEVAGFEDRVAAATGTIAVSSFRPGSTFTREPLFEKKLSYDAAPNVSAVNDLVTRTAKAILAALMPVALSAKRDEIKVAGG